jgi:hypothetical protein
MTLSERLGETLRPRPKPKTSSHRAQEEWYSGVVKQFWEHNHQKIVGILRDYIDKKMPNNNIKIDEDKQLIEIKYFALAIKPDKVGFRVEWVDKFDSKHSVTMNTLESFERYLTFRARNDWFKLNRDLKADIYADLEQTRVEIKEKRDIRWSFVGLISILLAILSLVLVYVTSVGHL